MKLKQVQAYNLTQNLLNYFIGLWQTGQSVISSLENNEKGSFSMGDEILKHITESRQRKQMSLEELASRSQLSLTELQDLEAGNTHQLFEWPLLKVKRLAEALDLNLSNLLGENILTYDEWALIWSALIEYSANRPGLNMKADMKELIQKVSSFIPDHKMNQIDG